MQNKRNSDFIALRYTKEGKEGVYSSSSCVSVSFLLVKEEATELFCSQRVWLLKRSLAFFPPTPLHYPGRKITQCILDYSGLIIRRQFCLFPWNFDIIIIWKITMSRSIQSSSQLFTSSCRVSPSKETCLIIKMYTSFRVDWPLKIIREECKFVLKKGSWSSLYAVMQRSNGIYKGA
jgi:hypothetical protein